MARRARHIAFVALAGFRVREQSVLDLGMSLPGLVRRGQAVAALPSLGVLTLAGLTPDPWTVSYHAVPRADDALVETLVAESPALAAVSALTASIEEAYALSAALRARGVPVVLGGLHVTACPEEASRHADAIVVGPGEYQWPQLLRDAASDGLRPVYRDARGDVDAWPQPRFDLLGDARPQRYTVQTERGCPLACDFCGASRLLGPFRQKPIEAVRRELAAVCARTKRPVIELADDNTFAGDRDVGELLDALAASGARWFTECDWRIGERPDVVSRLADAGCVQVLIGIESLVFRYPGMGAKSAEWNRVTAAIDAVQAAGVAVNGCFIFGADGETPASIDRLTAFILESNLAEVQLTLQTPFPGTGLRRRLASQGRLLRDRGWPYYTLFDVTFQPDRMTVEELENGFRSAVATVFSPQATARRERIRRSLRAGRKGYAR